VLDFALIYFFIQLILDGVTFWLSSTVGHIESLASW
jgi:hypothetical protein